MIPPQGRLRVSISRQIKISMNWPSVFLVSKRLFSGSPSRPSILKRAWDAYAKALVSRPLTTKTTAAALIFFTSDSATQYIMRDKMMPFQSQWDIARGLSGSAFGIVASMYLHFWWGFLEGMVQARIPVAEHRLANTLTKLVIDQGLAAPCYVYSYYVITNFLQAITSSTIDESKTATTILAEKHEKARTMLWPTMLRHWRLWPIVHTFNFYYVPLNHRVLVQNLVLVGWSGYLSYLNNGGLVTPKAEVDVTEEVLLDPNKERESPVVVLARKLTTVPVQQRKRDDPER